VLPSLEKLAGKDGVMALDTALDTARRACDFSQFQTEDETMPKQSLDADK